MKIQIPSLGEIEVIKICETPMNIDCESLVHTVYEDIKGNIYIDTWVTTGSDNIKTVCVKKEVIDLIIQTKNNMNNNDEEQ